MAKKILKTPLDGANAERVAILAKVRRLKRNTILSTYYLDVLEKWISQRNERYNKKAGGLGK
jgi:hypothetical protein